MLDTYFPTIDPDDPYRLTDEEEEVMRPSPLIFYTL